MTEQELRNRAYLIATGNSLTEAFDAEEWEKITEEEVMAVMWEPLENWTFNNICEHVDQIASAIINDFMDITNEESKT